LGQDLPGDAAFKYTALRFDGCDGRLIQNVPHLPVALRGTVAFGNFRAFFPARTTPDPPCQLHRRGKRGRLRPHFSDDLLRRIRPGPGASASIRLPQDPDRSHGWKA